MKKTKNIDDVKLPLVSIVLATRNEEANIANFITSIRKQEYPKNKIELIVVDLNSQDKTRKIAKSLKVRVYNLPKIKNLSKTKNFRGAQVNFGVEKSKGKYVFFPDTDMMFEEKLLKEAVDLSEKNDFDALYIPEEILGQGYFGKIRNFERSFHNQTCVDGVRFVKKELYLEIGGFDEKNIVFGPDDWDFTMSLKKKTDKTSILKSRIFRNETRITLGRYLQKKLGYIRIFDGYVSKWGKNDPNIKKQFSIFYRYFGIFLENGKWKRFIQRPDLVFGMYFLRITVGFLYFHNQFVNKMKFKKTN